VVNAWRAASVAALFRPLTILYGRNGRNRRNEEGDGALAIAESRTTEPEPSSLPAPSVPHSAGPTSTPASVPLLPASGPQEVPDAHDTDGTTLHTELLGDRVVSGRDAELQALSHHAAVYDSKIPDD